MAVKFVVEDEEVVTPVKVTIRQGKECCVDIMIDEWYVARLDGKTGKLLLYSGIEMVEGLALDDDNCIVTEKVTAT